MGFADDFLARQNAAQGLKGAESGSGLSDYLSGLASSAISSIPELFGQKPTQAAEQFRTENPVSGFVSEILPTLLPYAGMLKISELPAAAGLLERTVARTGLSAAETPVRYGLAKELVRYSPLEASRLAIGGATTEPDQWGNLLGDVGLSMALTGGFGALGGFLRAGGRVAAREADRVIGADLAFNPTWELRASLAPGAQLQSGGSVASYQRQKMLEVLTETPASFSRAGLKGKYVEGLEGASSEATAAVNSMFKAGGGEGQVKKLLMEGAAGDARTLNAGELDAMSKALGYGTPAEMAADMRFPRLTQLVSKAGAGSFWKQLSAGGLQDVGNGVWMARDSDGLFVLAKRWKAGDKSAFSKKAAIVKPTIEQTADIGIGPASLLSEFPKGNPGISVTFDDHWASAVYRDTTGTVRGAAKFPVSTEAKAILNEMNTFVSPAFRRKGIATKLYSALDNAGYKTATLSGKGDLTPAGAKFVTTLRRVQKAPVSEGDEWLLFKTDQPNKFVPDAAKVADSTVQQWSKYKPSYQPSLKSDPFNRGMNTLNDVLSPQDFNDLRSSSKQSWVSNKARQLTQRLGETTGIANSEEASRLASWLNDVVRPAMFQEVQNPLFGRLFSHLGASMRVADDLLNQIMGGRVKIAGSLNKAALRGGIQFEGGFGANEAVRKIVHSIPAEDLQAFKLAMEAELPQEAVQKLAESGAVSSQTLDAIGKLQRLNKDVLDQAFVPAIQGTEVENAFKPLEGYFGPRTWAGDWRVPVLDAKGNAVWLGAGKTLGAAKEQAQAVVDEAVSRGLGFKLGPSTHAVGEGPDVLAQLSDDIAKRVATSSELMDVVQKANTGLIVARAGNRAPGTVRNMGWMKERGGMPGSPDVATVEHEDIVKALESHYRSMLKYAGYHAWRQRWLPEALNLEKMDKTLFDNLMRKANQYVGVEGQITNVLNKTLQPVLGPILSGKAATEIARGTNRLMTAWNLSIANPTFALVNLLQPLQTVAPWISFVTRAPTAEVEKYMQVGLRFGADGKVRGTAGLLHPMKVLGEATKLMGHPTPELRQMMEQLKQEGLVSSHIHEHWLGAESEASLTIRDAFKKKGAWAGIQKIATYGADKSEELSRMVSANAAYLVGKDFFKLEGDALLQFMRQGVRVTNYGYSVVDRSRMFTGPVGSMFGLFKNWQMNYIGQMMQYAGVAVKHGEFGPLVWQLGSALGVGGLGATPLKMMADGLAKWYEDDRDTNSYLWMQEHWGSAADEIYYGLPAFLGVSLQASATTPGTDVGKDVSGLMNVVAWERAKQLGAAVGGAWDYAESVGKNPLNDPNIRDQLIGAVAPRAIFRAASVVEGDYIKSMRSGYPQVRGLTPLTKVLYGLGFNQLEVDREQFVSNELWKKQEVTRGQVQQLGKAFAAAQLNGDFDETTRLAQLAVMRGLPLSSVMSSANTILRREQQGDLLSRYDKGMVARYQQVQGE